jgi:hypothetical protein
MIGFIGAPLQLQSVVNAEASLHPTSLSTPHYKQLSLSPIKLRHGPRTENTMRTPYPSNSSIAIETEILLLLFAYSFLREYV